MHRDFILRPKASYCATREPDREFRDMVHALHQAGIECIMEMYFPERYAVLAGDAFTVVLETVIIM